MKIEEQLRAELRRRAYSYRTEESYVGWYRQYVDFHQLRHPRDYTAQELGAFLTHLGQNKGLSRATQGQAFNALIFLHKNMLGHELGEVHMWKPKEKRRIPNVLTTEEIVAVLKRIKGAAWPIGRRQR